MNVFAQENAKSSSYKQINSANVMSAAGHPEDAHTDGNQDYEGGSRKVDSMPNPFKVKQSENYEGGSCSAGSLPK